MKKLIIFIVLCIVLVGCGANKDLPETIGDPKNAVSFGYQPIDPLPVKIDYPTKKFRDSLVAINKVNSHIMSTLPDETMRLAIGQIDTKGEISFALAKTGYAGSSYIVILDYIKFDTKSLEVQIAKDEKGNLVDFRPFINNYDGQSRPDGIIPMYVGVGLRFTATITVNEGKVDLGNLFALGLAAESKKVTGTLLIQTLGISGKDISSLIPMPSQINTTTIQNAIMSLAAIKAKIYENEIDINPRVVGFYNNIGGGQNTVHKLISGVLSQGVVHKLSE